METFFAPRNAIGAGAMCTWTSLYICVSVICNPPQVPRARESARSQTPEPVPKFELLMPTRIRVGYKFAGGQEASRITVAAERKSN